MNKKKIFPRLAQYALIALIGSILLIIITVGMWLLWAVTGGIAFIFIVIIAMLIGFGLGAYQAKEACCRKWALKSKLVLLAAFFPMFCFSSLYLATVIYRINMKLYRGILSEVSAALDLFGSILFLGTVVLIFLTCIVFGAAEKRSKGGDSENKNNSI